MFAFQEIFSISRCGWYILTLAKVIVSNSFVFIARFHTPRSRIVDSWCGVTGAGQSSSLNQPSSHLPPPPSTPILSTNLGAKGRHETTDVDGGPPSPLSSLHYLPSPCSVASAATEKLCCVIQRFSGSPRPSGQPLSNLPSEFLPLFLTSTCRYQRHRSLETTTLMAASSGGSPLLFQYGNCF